MSLARFAPLASLLILASLFAPAQPPATQPPSANPISPSTSSTNVPTIHVTSRIVVLDVVVTDGHGHAIKGLNPSSFTLTEDGVPQKLASFTEHDAIADAAAASTAPSPAVAPAAASEPLPLNTFTVQPPIPADRPRTVIVLGALSFADAPQARYDLKKFVKSAPAGIPIAIFRGDWKGIHLVQDFTTDPKVLQEAANSKRILPPLGFVPPSQNRPPDTRGLASYLASIPGRINLIWISDGGAPIGEIVNSFSDVSQFLHDLNGTTNVVHLSRIAVYPIDANGVVVPGLDRADFDLESLFPNPITAPLITTPFETSSLALAGSGLFSTHGTSPFVDLIGCSQLSDLAVSTGGRAFCNTNAYAQAISEVVETGSHYYTISYAPSNSDWNGAVRHIHIDIPRETLQAGESKSEKFQDAIQSINEAPIRIEYRNQYRARAIPDIAQATPDSASPDPNRRIISYSPKGDPGAGHPTIPIQAAMGLGAPAPDAIHFKLTTTPSAKPDKLAPGAPLPRGNFLAAAWRAQPYRNVQLHYDITPQDLRFTSAAGVYRDSLQFVAILYRDDGVQVNSFTHTVPISGDAAWFVRMMSAPLALDMNIAIPTDGNYILRTAVHEVPTDRIGAIQLPTELIKLPPPTAVAAAQPKAP